MHETEQQRRQLATARRNSAGKLTQDDCTSTTQQKQAQMNKNRAQGGEGSQRRRRDSIVQRAHEGGTSPHPVLRRQRGRQVDRKHEVRGDACGRQHACAHCGLVHGATVVVHGRGIATAAAAMLVMSLMYGGDQQNRRHGLQQHSNT